MLYMPTVLSSRLSFTGWKKLEIILGNRSTLLMCLTNVLLRWPYVAWTCGRRAIDAGFSLVLRVYQHRVKGTSNLLKTVTVFF